MVTICQTKNQNLIVVLGLLFLMVSVIGLIYTSIVLVRELSQCKDAKNDTEVKLGFFRGNEEAWEAFKRDFKKDYTPDEEDRRKHIFWSNKRNIDEHNKLYHDGLRSYKLSINELADQTLDEILSMRKSLMNTTHLSAARTLSSKTPIQFDSSGKTLPESVDWREKGIVPPIMDQLYCLSCYAVVTAEAIESQYARIYGKPIHLSIQQIVDCSSAEGNLGCEGGMIDWSFQYVMHAEGLMAESDYPYTAEEGTCAFNKSAVAVSISNFVEIKNGSEIALQEAVAKFGPIPVAIDASSFQFNYFTDGIFDLSNCNEEVNHAVMVVGYGTENGTDYWLVKNSYGPSFGNKGYIKMSRNKNNQCSIASYASFPIISGWESENITDMYELPVNNHSSVTRPFLW